jgi:FkbH-like protein
MILDFQTLKSQTKGIKKDNFKKARIAILGNYATQFISKSIEYSGLKRSIEFETYNAEYDQIEQEIFDLNSGLYDFSPDFVFITISSLKLQDKFYSLSAEKKAHFTQDFIADLTNLINVLDSRLKTKIIINNLEILNDQVFGNIYAKVDQSFAGKIYELNYELLQLAKSFDNLYLFDFNGLVQYYGARNIRDWGQYVNADLHYSLDFHAAISEKLVTFIAAFLGVIKKCLIIDLDNTIWGGVIGDDGLQGIEIGTLGVGKSYTELQKWIKQLEERGIIIAVCSKNTEAIAKEPFEVHPEMVLRLEDIAVFVANWENKADNIRSIQQILNIGFDAMVFLDDNPAERAIVRQNIPAVCVPELPDDPALYLDYLKTLNLFETASFSTGDKNRTKQYQQEAERQKLQFSLTNIEDYLKSLQMEIVVEPFKPLDIPRIAQLTQRSNQFNLRTVRYSDNEIKDIGIDNPDYFTCAVKLKDKYGDYGLISVLILKKLNKEKLFIDTWVMSCRVLKRGVESAVVNYCVALAESNGFKQLVGEFIPTAKNDLVREHYPNLGFTDENGFWCLDIQNFKPLVHYIN